MLNLVFSHDQVLSGQGSERICPSVSTLSSGLNLQLTRGIRWFPHPDWQTPGAARQPVSRPAFLDLAYALYFLVLLCYPVAVKMLDPNRGVVAKLQPPQLQSF